MAEVAIVGSPDDPATRDLIRVAAGGYAPARVIAVALEGDASAIPLLRDRPMRDGRPTAYVCRSFACQSPVTQPDALRDQLRGTG